MQEKTNETKGFFVALTHKRKESLFLIEAEIEEEAIYAALSKISGKGKKTFTLLESGKIRAEVEGGETKEYRVYSKEVPLDQLREQIATHNRILAGGVAV